MIFDSQYPTPYSESPPTRIPTFLAPFALLFALILLTEAQGATLFVKPGGTGDGSSWESPLGAVQTAIYSATAGEEIWVASGTYDASIRMTTGVSLLGGFSGTEDTRDDRDWQANPTILEGGPFNPVIRVEWTEGVTVDGFTVTQGEGGVIFARIDSATLSNCVIIENGGNVNGGGVGIFSASPTVTNCLVTRNRACCGGGGLYAEFSNPTILNSVFTYNQGGDGGGVRVFVSNSLIADCTMSHNTAEDGGGATLASGWTTMINCAIADNTAEFGAGLQITDPSAQVLNCTIIGNRAGYGAGVFFKESNAHLTNCLVADNTATWRDGGGVFVRDASPTFTNCTIAGNYSELPGVGLSGFGSFPVLSNCIFWNLNVGEIVVEEVSPVVSFCNVQGGFPGIGNISAHPLFFNQDNGDFHLQAGSPCIDSASTNGPVTDLEGNPRPLDIVGTGRDGSGAFDMGAYEFIPGPTPGPTFVNPRSDIDRSGAVNSLDLLILIADWKKVTSASVESSFTH